MNRWRIYAPAKINRFLYVGPPDTSGYHPVITALQTVSLFDCIELTCEEEKGLFNWYGETTDPNLEIGHTTLALGLDKIRGHQKLRGRWHIRLVKNIPSGSGLGGASSDAAAILIGMNTILKLGLGHQELHRICQDIGKDVPFFLYGGTALAGGYGERVIPLPDLEEDGLFWLVMPPWHSDTAVTYRELDKVEGWSRELPHLDELARNSKYLQDHIGMANNDFKNILNKRSSEVNQFIEGINNEPELQIRWSGSGSCLWIKRVSKGNLFYPKWKRLYPDGWWFTEVHYLRRSQCSYLKHPLGS